EAYGATGEREVFEGIAPSAQRLALRADEAAHPIDESEIGVDAVRRSVVTLCIGGELWIARERSAAQVLVGTDMKVRARKERRVFLHEVVDECVGAVLADVEL